MKLLLILTLLLTGCTTDVANEYCFNPTYVSTICQVEDVTFNCKIPVCPETLVKAYQRRPVIKKGE